MEWKLNHIDFIDEYITGINGQLINLYQPKRPKESNCAIAVRVNTT